MAVAVVASSFVEAAVFSNTLSTADISLDPGELLVTIIYLLAGGQDLTDCTFNGATMTLIGGASYSPTASVPSIASSDTNAQIYWAYAFNDTGSTQTSAVTASLSANARIIIACVRVSGADPDNLWDAEVSAAYTGTAFDITIPSETGDLAIAATAARGGTDNQFTPDAGTTEEGEAFFSSGGGHNVIIVTKPGETSTALGGDWGFTPNPDDSIRIGFNINALAGEGGAVFSPYYALRRRRWMRN